MMLQALAGRDVQGRAFVLMGLCGVALGLLIHLGAQLHRWRPWAGHALDALTAALLLAAWQQVLLWCRTHPRLTQLLGLLAGVALYAGGLAPLLCRAMSIGRKAAKKFSPQGGKTAIRAESTVHRHEGGGMTDGSRSQGG